MATIYPVILDSFRCTAKDLAAHRLKSESMWLRPEDDFDGHGTWRLVRTTLARVARVRRFTSVW